jgi:hypothetical protein
MPRRSNEFQKLVYLVRVNLAAGATVTESKMLADLVTGREREVDVCVEGGVGGYPVRVCIECRDHARPADVTWVESMKAKHERLPTHALILASRSGFTDEAREVARRYGIEALPLDEVDQADFHALLEAKSSLWTKCVTVTAQKVIVRVIATPTLAAENVVVMPDNLVYASDGTELGPIVDLVQLVLNAPYAQRYLLTEGKEEHVWFEFRWEPPRDSRGNPLFLKKQEPLTLREIQYIEIKGPCDFKISEFHLRRGNFGGVQVAWGKTEIFGKEALVVATRDSAGLEKISLNIAGNPPEVGASRCSKRLQGTPASGRL